MFFSIISLVAGIVFVQQFSALPGLEWITLLFVLAVTVGYFRLWRLMFFTIGMLWAISFAGLRLADRLPENLEGKNIKIEGKVIGLPQADNRRVRFDFKVLNSPAQLPKKIRLSWFFPKQEVKAGQYWQFIVKLKKPHGRLNPGGFDYERWLFTQNIAATGYIKNAPLATLLATDTAWQNIDVMRQMISDKLTALLPDIENLGLIKALTIGDKHEVNDKQWEIFRKTGTIHLIAISGLHIGLISGLMYFLILKLAVTFSVVSPQKMAAIAAVMVAIFYSALAGFSVPTQRALIMLIIVMVASTLQRNILKRNTLSLAMLGVVIFDPLAVLSAGFWLSFLAVTLIVYVISGRLGKVGYWVGVTKIHCVTAIGLSPLLIFYFQQFSLIAPIANFIAVPIVSLLVVPLSFIAVLMMGISTDYALPLLIVIDEILTGLWFVLTILAKLPFADMAKVAHSFYVVPLALLGFFVLMSPRGTPARWLGCVLLLPLLFIKQERQNVGNFELTLLDVGQGLSAIIETTNHTLVFDTGAKYSEQFNMGSSVVIPFLNYKGINKIDTLLISHGDNDHIGGAKSIVDEVEVNTVLTSVPEMLEGEYASLCRAGQKWEWDQVEFEIVSPAVDVFKGENNNSCVLKVNSKYKGVLLTGDIEKQAESWLVNQHGSWLKSDVLIAPHHGSKTSSTLAFLKAVDPDIILIPAGYKNRFSFPHKQVIKRYTTLNKMWMNTADQGAIVIQIKEQKMNIRSMRDNNGRYWH